MKTVTRSRVRLIQHACHTAVVETRDGQEVLVVTGYDANADRITETVMKIVDDPKSGPKPYRPSDVVITAPGGQKFKIVAGPTDPTPQHLKIRKGRVAYKNKDWKP